MNSKNKKLYKQSQLFGRRLKYIRKDIIGISLKEMDLALGVAYQQIQKYESGENRIPVDKILLIHSMFSIPIGMFFLNLKTDTTEDGLIGLLQAEIKNLEPYIEIANNNEDAKSAEASMGLVFFLRNLESYIMNDDFDGQSITRAGQCLH